MQARILTPDELAAVLAACDPKTCGKLVAAEDRALILATHKAALRACEVAALSWPMLLDASGRLADAISLPAVAAKRHGAGCIPMTESLFVAIDALWRERGCPRTGPVFGRPGKGETNADAMAVRIKRLYWRALGKQQGLGSHVGRRTAITTLIRNGAPLAEVKVYARHVREATTLSYVTADMPSIAAHVAKLG